MTDLAERPVTLRDLEEALAVTRRPQIKPVDWIKIAGGILAVGGMLFGLMSYIFVTSQSASAQHSELAREIAENKAKFDIQELYNSQFQKTQTRIERELDILKNQESRKWKP